MLGGLLEKLILFLVLVVVLEVENGKVIGILFVSLGVVLFCVFV